MKIICIGRNYLDHISELNNDIPTEPIFFMKQENALCKKNQPFFLPDFSEEIHYEAELVIVIGKRAKNIEMDNVEKYILGYTCGNDVSARDCQLRIDKQWARGKSFDTFCPLGPWIETELANPDNCCIVSRLNGKIMQDSNTSDLIFGVKELVSYCSKNFTLLPGTVIMTGTPSGVGFARRPPVFLKKGDHIEIEIEGIGILSNKVWG